MTRQALRGYWYDVQIACWYRPRRWVSQGWQRARAWLGEVRCL